MVKPATRRDRFIRFSDFEVDLDSRELFKNGRKVKMQGQPFEVLAALLDRRGEMVSREELRQKIWPSETAGDFDQGLNRAINKVREALGDSAESPRFVETLPRRGYRFVGSIHEESYAQTAPEEASPLVAPLQTSSPPPEAPNRRLQGKKWLSSIAVAVVAALLAGYFYRHRTPKLTGKDKIVLADFTNLTGDPVFDGTLRQGMAVQLEQSPFLSLVSDERVQQILRMMGQPADARLTQEIAREICERTASAVVLDGSIATLGSQYVLTLRAENCRTGDVLDEEQVQASKKEDVLNALTHIASRSRTRLGESLSTVQKYDTPLAEATTPSLEALKAYSAGWKVLFSTGSAAAVPLFKRAIEIDPKFAMAHAALGRMYGDIGESTLSAESTGQAYQLRNRASDEEKFFIATSYDKQVTGNLEKAEQTCELWIQSYPRALVPHAFLSGNISLNRGDYEKSIDEAEIAIGLDPDVSILYSNLALSDVALGRIDEAENVLRQAPERKLGIPDFAIQRYAIAFLKGDLASMDREATQVRGKPGAEEWMSNAESFVLAYSGHQEEARKMSRRAVDLAHGEERRETEAYYEADMALREALFGNASMARQRAIAALDLSTSRDVEYAAAFALAASGDPSRPQSLVTDLSKRFPEDTKVRFIFAPTLRALLALNHSEPSKAVELLQTAIPYEGGILSSGGSEPLLGAGNLYPAYVRGEAYLAARQGREAAVEFQKILDHRGIVVSDPIRALAHLQLGRAYVMAGDKEKARTAYMDFLTLWKDADSDIPVLKEAKEEYAKLQQQNYFHAGERAISGQVTH
jgi:DNA-binding winged helix-turn-helix (wHTH) protein/lipopolysaccharide biosynthesis regulator YciM